MSPLYDLSALPTGAREEPSGVESLKKPNPNVTEPSVNLVERSATASAWHSARAQRYNKRSGVRTRTHTSFEPRPDDREDLILVGFLAQKLTAFLALSSGDIRNLSFLYFATFIMRAAAFAGVAVMQHVMYPDPRDALWRGLLFAG